METRWLAQMCSQLLVKNGLFFRQFESHDGTTHRLQLVVPKVLHNLVLQRFHSGPVSGHLGEDKTLSHLKERFYRSGHWTDNRNWCRICASCVTWKTAEPKQRVSLQSIRTGSPMHLVAADIIWPLPESKADK